MSEETTKPDTQSAADAATEASDERVKEIVDNHIEKYRGAYERLSDA